MAQFLWNVKGETRTYWINWRNLCYPELERVLGFRSVDQIQDALQAKLMWLALSGDSLRANFIRMKCFVHDQPRIQINPSPLWRPPCFLTMNFCLKILNGWLEQESVVFGLTTS